jgi:hypothetical protein
VLMPLARGLILILRLPLLVLIGVGALVVCVAARIDDWLRSWRSSLAGSRSVVVPLADTTLPQPIVARKLASS